MTTDMSWVAIREALFEERAVIYKAEEPLVVESRNLIIAEMRGALKAAKAVLGALYLVGAEQEALWWVERCLELKLGASNGRERAEEKQGSFLFDPQESAGAGSPGHASRG